MTITTAGLLLTVALTALITLTLAQSDGTTTPEASGHDIVESTLTRIESECIFGDDKLLMRRIGYVESNDGLHPDTFRDGYHGGIWQVRKKINTKNINIIKSVLNNQYN